MPSSKYEYLIQYNSLNILFLANYIVQPYFVHVTCKKLWAKSLIMQGSSNWTIQVINAFIFYLIFNVHVKTYSSFYLCHDSTLYIVQYVHCCHLAQSLLQSWQSANPFFQSEWGLPYPLTRRRVCLPPFGGRGDGGVPIPTRGHIYVLWGGLCSVNKFTISIIETQYCTLLATFFVIIFVLCHIMHFQSCPVLYCARYRLRNSALGIRKKNLALSMRSARVLLRKGSKFHNAVTVYIIFSLFLEQALTNINFSKFYAISLWKV